MLTHDDWFVLLERQAANIEDITAAIDYAEAKGMSALFARSTLEDDLRLYRRLLASAPVDVLFEHASTSAKVRHL